MGAESERVPLFLLGAQSDDKTSLGYSSFDTPGKFVSQVLGYVFRVLGYVFKDLGYMFQVFVQRLLRSVFCITHSINKINIFFIHLQFNIYRIFQNLNYN